jgi:hypothetical protein
VTFFSPLSTPLTGRADCAITIANTISWNFGSPLLDLQAMTTDQALLEAALAGYQQQYEDIQARMAEIRRMLRTTPAAALSTASSSSAAPVKKRKISAAGRRRMAEAQRKRWAAQKGTKEAPAKRHMSAAGRKRIADAAKKRWAAFRAKKTES